MRNNLRTQTPLPCKLFWGTDPRIELDGVAVEVGVDTVIIVLEDGDPRLWPEPGRKVQIEIEWPGEIAGKQKSLRCRGAIEMALASGDGSMKFSCRIRTGRFTDAKANDKVRGRARVNGWTM